MIKASGFICRPGDNQRCSGLIDEDGVHLVYNSVCKGPLHHLLCLENHVVSEVVEAKFIISAIGHISIICLSPLVKVQSVDDYAHAKTQKSIDLSHPLGITVGKIIVDSNHMNTTASEGIEVDRQGGN